jgi:hypothetical protein
MRPVLATSDGLFYFWPQVQRSHAVTESTGWFASHDPTEERDMRGRKTLRNSDIVGVDFSRVRTQRLKIEGVKGPDPRTWSGPFRLQRAREFFPFSNLDLFPV